MTLREIKIQFEERFQQKWTSLSIQYHFKSIVSHLLSIPFGEVNLNLNVVPGEKFSSAFQEIIDQLLLDKPLQYILGETTFRDCRIFCSSSALIPRPETEELVEIVLNTVQNIPTPKILDLCTGTGCIAIAIQKEKMNAIVFAVEKFEEALDLADKNNVENETNVNFFQADVLDPHQMEKFETGDFDIWVSNPPYIPIRDKALMEKNVLDFEPETALFVSNENPLLFYARIATSALKGLKQGGVLFFEIHEDFGQEMIDLLRELGFSNVQLYSDLQGKSRMISATKK